MKIDGYQMNQSTYSSSLVTESVNYSVDQHLVEVEVEAPKVLSVDRPVDWDENYEIDAQEQVEEVNEHLADEDQKKIKLLEAFISYITGKPFSFQKVMRLNPYRYKDDEGVKKYVQPHRKPVPEKAKAEENLETLKTSEISETSETPENPKKEETKVMIPRLMTRVTAQVEHYEKETYSFNSSGKVTTEDGRQIEIEYNMSMSHEAYSKTNVQYETIDPLTFSFDGTGIKASKFKIEIDLDVDGQKESITAPGENAGFLALDKNDNGEIDDGSELFGAKTGQGFKELRAYDEDQNGWIDENDTIFKSLKIWSFDEDGNQTLTGLLDADVGAIYLGEVSGQYRLQSEDTTYAELKASSIYLKESGGVGSIHQLDFVV